MCPNCSSNWLVRQERACPPVPSAPHACKWRVVLINDAGAPLCPPDNVCLMCLSSDASRPPPPPPPPPLSSSCVPLRHACLLRVVVATTRVPACLLGLSALFYPTSLPSHHGHVALLSFIIRVTAGGGGEITHKPPLLVFHEAEVMGGGRSEGIHPSSRDPLSFHLLIIRKGRFRCGTFRNFHPLTRFFVTVDTTSSA